MEFMLDTANLNQIKNLNETYPLNGITSNPSILKIEGTIDFFNHMRSIRRIVGFGKSIHVQVTAFECGGMIREAEHIHRHIDNEVYIKIPATGEGLRAIRSLREKRFPLTATGIYTRLQGFMAINSGAEYIACYYNRLEALDIQAAKTIESFRTIIERSGSPVKILAASFRNSKQVCDALSAGAHAVTLPPSVLLEAFCHPSIRKAEDDFRNDWVSTQGSAGIDEL